MPLKQILDIISTLSNSEKALEARALIFEMEKEMFELREKNFDLKVKLDECSNRVAENLKWEKTKSLYTLYQTPCNAIVYVPLQGRDFPEFLCPTCFDSKKIIHLQPSTNSDYKQCFVCDKSYRFDKRNT